MTLDTLTLDEFEKAQAHNYREFAEKIPDFTRAFEGLLTLFRLITAEPLPQRRRPIGYLLLQAQKAFCHSAITVMRLNPVEAMMFVRVGVEAALYARRITGAATDAEFNDLAKLWLEHTKDHKRRKEFEGKFHGKQNYESFEQDVKKLVGIRKMASQYASHANLEALCFSMKETTDKVLKLDFFVDNDIIRWAMFVTDSFWSVVVTFEECLAERLRENDGYKQIRKTVREHIAGLKMAYKDRLLAGHPQQRVGANLPTPTA